MKELFYLGTYTKRASQGVYSVILNHETKQFEPIQLVAELNNPTYLTADASAQHIYAVSSKEGLGGVTVLQKEADNTYTTLAQDHFAKATPCYIALDEQQKTLVTSNYHEGTIVLYTIEANGQLTRRDEAKHIGSSIHPNQTAPHVHYSHPTPDGMFIVACDLGTDRVVTYRITSEQTLQEVATYTSTLGAGPRHLAFHPTLPFAYLLCELNATIEVLNFNRSDGTFTLIEQHALLKDTPTDQAWGAAIRITKDGSYVYATNRGYDCLVAYRVDDTTGSLTHLQSVATGGSVARDFNLSLNEQFIVVSHQESDYLSLFERDQATGLVQQLDATCYAPEAVCVYSAQYLS